MQPQVSQYSSPYAQSTQPQPFVSTNPQGQQFAWYSSYYNQNTPQQINELQTWFNAVDKDHSGTISAQELASQPFAGQPLGYNTATKLINIFDKDFSGQLDFVEYASLHQFLLRMQNAFYTADRDRSGYLDDREIFEALQASGFQLSYPTVKEVCSRFDYIPGRGLSIFSYLQVCIHLARLRSIFEWNDVQRRGTVTLTYDQLSHISTHLLDNKGSTV
jgi:Ca2+-binding EF-hand superfamily protein